MEIFDREVMNEKVQYFNENLMKTIKKNYYKMSF
jgi:hypothetical protein